MGSLNIRDVPADVHRAFKVLCAQRDTNIRAEIIRLMQQELAQAAKGKK